jgi:acylphosphatase
MSGDVVTRRVRVRGRVQGVWYRAWTVEQALALGLDGWVRNRRDGSVEIVARGTAEAVGELVARCRRGPSAARVERVEEQSAADEIQPGFRALPTA